jgi:murein DD-endopeptidase MepM/ murein hydrolase activator NlpD
MPQLTHRETSDVFGIAYRAVKSALARLSEARAALVELVDNAVAEELEAAMKAEQKTLKAQMVALYQAACEGDAVHGAKVVMLRPLPVEGRRIIKRFNDPIRPNGPRSEGLVFDANLGDPVVAPIDGTVREAGVMGGVGAGGFWGKRIAITSRVDPQTTVWLAHLDAVDVSVGDVVNAGDIIGRAGNSGNATQPQVLLIVQDDAAGLRMANVPFLVADPWPLLFDKDPSDAYYLEVEKVES